MGDSKSWKCHDPLLLLHQLLQTKATQGLCISGFLQKEANEANLCCAGVPILYMRTLRLKGIKKRVLVHMRW